MTRIWQFCLCVVAMCAASTLSHASTPSNFIFPNNQGYLTYNISTWAYECETVSGTYWQYEKYTYTSLIYYPHSGATGSQLMGGGSFIVTVSGNWGPNCTDKPGASPSYLVLKPNNCTCTITVYPEAGQIYATIQEN